MRALPPVPLPTRRSRFFAWWYLTIALGFALLAINQAFIRRDMWPVVLRLVIAAGFAALAYIEFRSRTRQ
jgi:hypothetical protein